MKSILKISSLIFILLFITTLLYRNTLYFKINNLIKDKDAQIGIAVIKNNKIYTIGNRKQPLLSVFKYCVALKVLSKLEQEKTSLEKKIIIEKEMVDPNLYSPMLKKYKTFPFSISIGELLEYAVSQSDNNACDILISYSGGIQALNSFIHNIGFNEIEIYVNEKEMNTDITKQYWNKAYPKDILKLMKFTREKNLLSNKSKTFLDNIMINAKTGENKIKGALPKNVIVGHKTGSSSRTTDGIKIADNDAGYVILPDGTVYYIAVMIKDSKMSDDDNAKIIREISKIIYEYFSKHIDKV